MAEKNLEKSIFLHAIGLASPTDRGAYLDNACRNQPQLRAEVDALLAAHIRLGGAIPPAIQADATKTNTGTPESAGAAVGPYKLIEPIGEGGMGTVWMAQQTEPVKRLVAIKLIKPGMDSRQIIARFEAERQALALMDHANIARVLEAGTTEAGRPYFVMDLVKGVPITRYCDEHHLTPRRRLELFIPVCDAVQHAHQKGIIHRDLKPSNVLVALYDGKPVPKVIDFGVAKATGQSLTEKTLVTGFGNIVGTLEYMSPEQAEINQLDIDTRSDIYSLGVLLYELLTGSPPFTKKELEKAGMLEMLRVIREQEPSKPSTKLSTADGLPTLAANRGTEPAKLTKLMRGELDWIVMKALEKDRSRRYETASGFALDVQRYLADEPVLACPPSVGYRFRKFARRNKAAFVTASVAVVVVLLALVGLAVSNVLITREKNEKVAALLQANINEKAAKTQQTLAENNAKTAAEQTAIAVANEKLAKDNELLARRYLYAAHMIVVQQSVEVSQDPARALQLLSLHRPGPGQTDLRSFEWYYWWDRCHYRLLRTLDKHANSVVALALSPDGQTLASAGDGTVRIWDVASGQERASLPGHDRFDSLAFSPDGKILAASGNRDGSVSLWDLATRQEAGRLEGHARIVRSVAFAAHGLTLAAGSANGTVKVWDVATRTLKQNFQGSGSPVQFVALSPSGEKIAVATGRVGERAKDKGVIKLWNAATGLSEALFEADDEQPTSVAFSPDGRTLAASINVFQREGVVYLWDVGTKKLKATLKGHDLGLTSVAFSPEGQMLASGGEDRSIIVWDVSTGNAKFKLLGHGRDVTALLFLPDRKTLVSGSMDHTVKFWDLGAPEPITHLVKGELSEQALAYSRDGRSLASAGMDQTVKLWDPGTGQLKATFTGHTKSISDLAFSPDGRLLASGAYDRKVMVWDLRTGKSPRTVEGDDGENNPVAFSPDSRVMATSAPDHTVRLWDAGTGALKAALKGHTQSVVALAFSPDGQTLVSLGWDRTARLWDVASGTTKRTLTGRGHVPFASAAFSPDGKVLATGSGYATIEFWDVETGALRATLAGHTSTVWSLSFSPDGKTLASSAYGERVKLWDTITGEPKATFNFSSRTLAFSPDGTILAACRWPKGVYLFRAATEKDVLAREGSTRAPDRMKRE